MSLWVKEKAIFGRFRNIVLYRKSKQFLRGLEISCSGRLRLGLYDDEGERESSYREDF
jgi:hypothetical protein